MPYIAIVGLPDTAVREGAVIRVKATVIISGYRFPYKPRDSKPCLQTARRRRF